MFSGLNKIVTDITTKSLETSYLKHAEHADKPRNVRHILELNREEKQVFLESFDIIFCDCDGVLWEYFKQIDGVGEAIKLLRNANKKIAFVSNNSVRKNENYLKQFKESGIELDLKDLIHPVLGIVDYLKKIKFDGLIYCIGTTTFKDVLKKEGFKIIDGPNKIIENLTDLMVFDNEPVRAIVIDTDLNLSISKLIRAEIYLKNPECILIAGAIDESIHVKKGINIIGPGAFVKILENASGKKAIALGKPGKELGQLLIERYHIKHPKRVLFIGDMLEQDIAFGNVCGFQTLAVLTGGCNKNDFETHDKDNEIPDYYANSLKDFIKFFNNLKE